VDNQIDIIEQLYAKKKSYKIPKEEIEGVKQLTLVITPLSLEDMGVLNMKEDMPSSELARNAKVMFSKSLGISEEQASKISFEYMEDILSAIMDANNFKDEDMKKTGIKDFIQKKKDQIKEKEEQKNAESNRPA